jgi:AraC-like DNA-binding protein
MRQRIQDGFKNQRMITVSQEIVNNLQQHPLTKNLFITNIGHFPDTRFHYVERKDGLNDHLLIYCVDGNGWFQTNGVRYKITPDQYFIIPKGQPHLYGADQRHPWSIYWIHFDGTESSALTEDSQRAISLETKSQKKRIQSFEEIYTFFDHGAAMQNMPYVSICLWKFLGSFVYHQQFDQAQFPIGKDIIDQTIQYMQNNIEKNLSLKHLTSEVGLSPAHFSYLFKQKIGYSPMNYFSQLKIQKACQFLSFTQLQINEIGWQLGFEDPFYFSRVFNKIMGKSPQAYRLHQSG